MAKKNKTSEYVDFNLKLIEELKTTAKNMSVKEKSELIKRMFLKDNK
jgi:hypothetical protein